jgi:hypothetical protein
MIERYGTSDIHTTPDRRWRDNLSPAETRERNRLEEARFNGGLTPEDRLRYEQLTAPRPIEAVEWSRLPAGLYDQAERRVEQRRLRAAGLLPRDQRTPGEIRHRLPSYNNPSFGRQIGKINTTTDPFVLQRAVRDLRRNAKRLGLFPASHDRRKRATCTPSAR